MRLEDICRRIEGLFGEYWLESEYSNNGLQVEACHEVNKVAFAVDACHETINKAHELGAELLIVHHGLSWGRGITRFTGVDAQRFGELFRYGISLFACHLPLDAHRDIGNNAVLAKRLGYDVTEWFSENYRLKLGCICRFEKTVELKELLRNVVANVSSGACLYDNSQGMTSSLAILSGSGDDSIYECSERGVKCLLTGEFAHKNFHAAKELGISLIRAGHYDTENTGIHELMKSVQKCADVDVCFIDAPTGL